MRKGIKRRLSLYRIVVAELVDIYKSNRFAMVGLIGITVLVFTALFAQYISPYDISQRSEEILRPPSYNHILGTDDVGKDILSLIIHGSRASLLIGLAATTIAVLIGTAVGMLSGYFGGIKGEILMRVTDMFLVLPALPFMIVLAAILQPNIWNVIIAIGVTSWTHTARITRSLVLSLRERAYILRAKAIGCSDVRIIYKYIVPQIIPIVLACGVVIAANAIASEAILSFIGLGDIRVVSWGTILYFAFQSGAFTRGAWWYFLPPGICITATVLMFILVGQGFDEIINPKLRKV
ncbi:MAG: ABC transporter permease [Candidatus Methanomethylicia archaeon]